MQSAPLRLLPSLLMHGWYYVPIRKEEGNLITSTDMEDLLPAAPGRGVAIGV